MSSFIISVKANRSQSGMQQRFQPSSSKPKEAALALSQFFKNLASGTDRASVDVQTGSADPVAASGTLTLTSAIATDAVTIGAVTLTGSDTPANENQWNTSGADDAADAAALAAAINAHSVLSLVVSASSAANVVTISARQKGVVGNQIPLSSADATIVASASFLASGAGGVTDAAVSYNLGIS
ncbi:MAG: hypothetical protein ACOH5I_26480 [Oligoflexus sp.]